MKILFVHGLGASSSWWDRFAHGFNSAGFDTHILHMPDFSEGPDTWVDFVIRNYKQDSQTIIVGHSLGGAVALEAARRQIPAAVICLAIPIAIGKLQDPPVVLDDLSEQMKKVILNTDHFLKSAVEKQFPACPILYFYGTNDIFVEIEAVKLLSFPAMAISGAGHDLNRDKKCITTIVLETIRFLEENNCSTN
jgi:pimeloyl-ACP methyl ester carboxylesterase